MNKINIEKDYFSIRIFISGLQHFFIKRKEVISIQSWIIQEDKYIIEYSTKDRDIKCVYEKFEDWQEILKQLSQIDFN